MTNRPATFSALVVTAPAIDGGIGNVHAEQRRRSPAGGNQKSAARQTEALGVDIRGIERETPRVMMHRVERNRLEFAVGGRVELDRQARSCWVVAIAHGVAHLSLVTCSARTSMQTNG